MTLVIGGINFSPLNSRLSEMSTTILKPHRSIDSLLPYSQVKYHKIVHTWVLLALNQQFPKAETGGE